MHATPPGARRTTVTGSGTPRPPRSPSLRMRVDGYMRVFTPVSERVHMHAVRVRM